MVRAYVESPFADAHIEAIEEDIREWLANAVARDAQIFAPFDTGYLKTHGIEVSPDHRRVTATGAGMPPNADAPAYVEFGTRPHDIPNAWGLGITVRHPGTEAQPFLRPAAYKKRPIPPWVVHARANLADR